MKILEYIEIDIDYCSEVYGTSPCTASVGVTGTKKCFNSLATCQDRANFDNVPVTLRFAVDTGYNPTDIEAIPNVVGIDIAPSVISLGKDLGIRSSVTVRFKEHRHSDTGPGHDKYIADRSYDPWQQGTFWARFRSRQPYLRGRSLRVIRGSVGQSLAAMETRHYVIDSFSGPSTDGTFTIVAKDVLKLADNDRAVAPTPNTGVLNASITDSATSATLSPSGIGDLEYASSGYLTIGGKESCTFTRSGDTLTLTRGQRGSDAIAHNADSRVQQYLDYTGQSPDVIIEDLLTTYAGVPSSYISTTTWAAETAAYLQKVYTAYIAEPTGVNQLISELIEQAALALWWDDENEQIKLQVLRDVPKDAQQFDDNNIMSGSTRIIDQPNERVSQVWVRYAQRNPLRPLTDLDNYKAIYINTDADSESDYGSAVIRSINSRWIPEFGDAIANRLSDIVLARFVNAPRRIEFDVMKTAQLMPQLGGGYNVGSFILQDDEGAPDIIPVQVLSVKRGKSSNHIVSEELRFTGVELDDPNDRVITIDSDTFDFNLRTVHDTLFPEITTVGDITLTVNIGAGVTVGATSTSAVAFNVGSWPNLPPITINIEGRIQGAGGAGGSGNGSGEDGSAGGTALTTTVAITVDNQGEIYGGGGGGGGNDSLFGGTGQRPSGGGGAGSVPGAGGINHPDSLPPTNPSGYNGSAGTSEAGGVGGKGFSGSSIIGGTGGGFGAAGSNCTNGGGVGGAAGNAIDGVSNITFTTAGTRAGGEIN